MKKNSAFFLLTMWWFILCFMMGSLILFFTPNGERIAYEENRVLQNRPEISVGSIQSGEYADQFESFLSDSVPGRRLIIKLSDRMLSWISMVMGMKSAGNLKRVRIRLNILHIFKILNRHLFQPQRV